MPTVHDATEIMHRTGRTGRARRTIAGGREPIRPSGADRIEHSNSARPRVHQSRRLSTRPITTPAANAAPSEANG
jgi:hypothetical protein